MLSSFTKTLIIFSVVCSTVMAQSQPGYQKYVDWAWGGNFDPMVDVSFGISNPEYFGFNSNFSQIGAINAMLGYSEIVPYHKYVVSLDERFAFFGFNSPEYALEETSEVTLRYMKVNRY